MIYKIKSLIRRFLRHYMTPKSDCKYIDLVCERTGWTRRKARKEMNRALKNGMSYKYYVKRKAWAKSDEQMQEAVRNLQRVNRRNDEEREHYISAVCEETSWPREEFQRKFFAAQKNCGCSYKDFYKFRLFEKSPEKQQTYITLRVSEDLLFKYNTNPEESNLLLHKEEFAKKYNDLMSRKWFMNRDLSYEQFLEKIEGVEDLICKPASSTQGKGIIKIHCGIDVEDKREVYEHLVNEKKRMICEEYIIQHPEVAAFNPSSVNSIRVLTIVDQGKCHHVYAGFRMGCGKIVDNFHAGGIISTIDVETGITCMDAIDLDGNHYPKHPISEIDILGFRIPHWQQILELTEQAAMRLDGVGMVGWDIAVTKDSVCLIEGNSQASYMIIQLPYVERDVGMKSLFAPFL